MNIKKLPKSQIEIRISIPCAEWEVFLTPSVEEISRDIKIEGFRPGKAPREIVEQKVGKEAVLNAAAEKAIRKNYAKILKEEKLEAIGAPQVEILKLAENNELEYKVTTAVMPKISLADDWEKEVIKINKEYVGKKNEISNDEIKKELKKLANSRVKLVTVIREAKSGDSVELDFEVSQNGVPIENGSAKKHNMILGRGAFIPGFEDNIIGMKAGEEKSFSLSFPAKYHAKHLAGKPADFKVKLNLVQERIVPEINNDFVKSLGKFKNLDELNKSVMDGMLKEKEIQQREKRRADIVEKLVEKTKAEFPDILIQEELQKMIGEFEAQIQGAGMRLEQYLQQMKKTRGDLEKDWKPQAEKRVKSAMALDKIAQEKEIKIDSAEIEKEMNATLQYYKNVKDLEKNLDMERLFNYTKGMLINEEVFKLLEKI